LVLKAKDHAHAVKEKADGIVVGSALINRLKKTISDPALTAAWVTESFMRELG
jgi:tryptophan synthase alpha subunit